MNIVLIIDNPTDTMIMMGALRPMGHQINSMSAPENLDEIARNEPDLLMISIGWTVEQDLALLHDIRLDSRFDDIPILVISNLDMEDVRHQCYELGCQEFITQPISPQNLRAVVESYLDS